MMFRRLYWVAEQVDQKSGRSKVTGVYTSIQDLVQKGFQWCDGGSGPTGYRLTLLKPDSFNCPLGVWDAPRFEGILNDMNEYVESGEYTKDEIATLETAIGQFVDQSKRQAFNGPVARAG